VLVIAMPRLCINTLYNKHLRDTIPFAKNHSTPADEASGWNRFQMGILLGVSTTSPRLFFSWQVWLTAAGRQDRLVLCRDPDKEWC
jgi:hypothetical protein